jgi:hypothetical protein
MILEPDAVVSATLFAHGSESNAVPSGEAIAKYVGINSAVRLLDNAPIFE